MNRLTDNTSSASGSRKLTRLGGENRRSAKRNTDVPAVKSKKLKASVLTIARTSLVSLAPRIKIDWSTLESEASIFDIELAQMRTKYLGLDALNLVNNVICLKVEPECTTEPLTDDYLDIALLKKYLNLNAVAYSYQPDKFSGLTYRFIPSSSVLKQLQRQITSKTKKIKHVTFLCFQSGQLVIVGLKTCDIDVLKRLITQFLQALGEAEAFKQPVVVGPKVSNMVFSFEVGGNSSKTLSLYKFAQAKEAGAHVQYYPNLFPGAKLLIPNSSAICTLFTSKKAIFTGGGGFNVQYFKQGITLLGNILLEMGINIEKSKTIDE